MTEIENDGFITPTWGLQTLEHKEEGKAIPVRECRYPRCEECRDYISRDGRWYCTVPMVISKQVWLMANELMMGFDKRISLVEEFIDETMFSSKTPTQVRESERRIDAEDLLVDGMD